MVIKSQTFTFYVSYIRIYISDLIITIRNVVAARLFSQASVILFTEGGRVCVAAGCAWQGPCVAGGMHGGGMHGRGVCVVGACMAGAMSTAVDSIHPTGMHPCCPRQTPLLGRPPKADTPPPGQTPPPPGYYGIRSTSGRNASYWNTYL